jgi:aldehyde:ferredoxin oxidoreductase
LFARNLYTSDLVERALRVAGMEQSGDDLARLGQETLTLKHEFKRRCGFDLEGVRIPRRILETPTPAGRLEEGFIRQALQAYREAVLPAAVPA